MSTGAEDLDLRHAFHYFTIAQTKNFLDQQGPECYTDIQRYFSSTMAFEVSGIL